MFLLKQILLQCHSQGKKLPKMNAIDITAKGVANLLAGLNPSKAMGPGELHTQVLKELSNELSSVFSSHVFQQSAEKGTLPSVWKDANMYPTIQKERSVSS